MLHLAVAGCVSKDLFREAPDVELAEHTVGWLPAQQHAGHNIGDPPTRVILVELKEHQTDPAESEAVGPTEI